MGQLYQSCSSYSYDCDEAVNCMKKLRDVPIYSAQNRVKRSKELIIGLMLSIMINIIALILFISGIDNHIHPIDIILGGLMYLAIVIFFLVPSLILELITAIVLIIKPPKLLTIALVINVLSSAISFFLQSGFGYYNQFRFWMVLMCFPISVTLKIIGLINQKNFYKETMQRSEVLIARADQQHYNTNNSKNKKK